MTTTYYNNSEKYSLSLYVVDQLSWQWITIVLLPSPSMYIHSMLMHNTFIVRLYFHCTKLWKTVMRIHLYFYRYDYSILIFLFPTIHMLISETNFMKPAISPLLKYVHNNMNNSYCMQRRRKVVNSGGGLISQQENFLW